jgi:hypothetical protein
MPIHDTAAEQHMARLKEKIKHSSGKKRFGYRVLLWLLILQSVAVVRATKPD